jgi:hypothetical protein
LNKPKQWKQKFWSLLIGRLGVKGKHQPHQPSPIPPINP